MAHTRPDPTTTLTLGCALLLGLTAPAGAQTQEATTLPAVTITGRSATSSAGVSGFGDLPLSRAPFQARTLGSAQLQDSGVDNLAGITRFDASVSDAYSSEGYWANFRVRGFDVDTRYNFRRDGLPINAQTHIPLANKESVEILKGTTGIQAGTSAPGGLVNLTVKRPDGDFSSATLGWVEPNSFGAAVDLSRRFGAADAFGLRLNLAHSELDPHTRALEGRSSLAALAADWRVAAGTLVEAEFELSRKTQRSLAAMSLLGGSVPSAEAFDPRINLNNQPWAQPVVLDGDTASLRLRHELAEGWEGYAHLGLQRLRSDDRMAFPLGCSAEGNYDRYCSDGSFDYYDFRSENERRDSNAFDVGARGSFVTGSVTHQAAGGILYTRSKARFDRQAYNWVGVGTIDGTAVVPQDPALTDENTQRDERSIELYLRDQATLTEGTNLFAGLRHTRIARSSIRTDGSRPTDVDQHFTTPWLALTQQLTPQLMGYVSWGQGIESDVTPNRARFTNRGEATTLRTKQAELGLKAQGDPLLWSATLFSVERPYILNAGTDCGSDTPGNTCTRGLDGRQRHQGLEADVEWRARTFAVQASAMLLHARLSGIANEPGLNGKRPTNVPARTLRLNARHDLAAVPGLRLTGGAVYEGPRMVLPDNSIQIPGWTRLDAGLRYEQRLPGSGAGTLVWRFGVENLTDKRAWKESPYQFEHAYLYPMSRRTFRLSVEATL